MSRFRALSALVAALSLGAACTANAPNPLSPASGSPPALGTSAQPPAYDAAGLWNALVYLGDQQIGSGVHLFSQDAEGNLIAVGTEPIGDPERDLSTYTFTRLNAAQAPVGKYRVTIIATELVPGGACLRNLAGKATLHAATNTLEAEVTGVIDNCSTVTVRLVWQKQ